MASALLIIRTIQNLSYSGKLIAVSENGIEVCINEKVGIHYFFPSGEVSSVFWRGDKLTYAEFINSYLVKEEQ